MYLGYLLISNTQKGHFAIFQRIVIAGTNLDQQSELEISLHTV